MQKEDLYGFLVRARSRNTEKGQKKIKMQDTLWRLSVEAQRNEARKNGKLAEWQRNDEPQLVIALTSASAQHCKKSAKEPQVLG